MSVTCRLRDVRRPRSRSPPAAPTYAVLPSIATYSGSRLRLTGRSAPCGAGPKTRTSAGRVLPPPPRTRGSRPCVTSFCFGAASLLRELHDAHRALRVDREVVGRLALVRDDGVLAVGRDRHHVGQRTDRDLAEHGGCGIRRVRVEEHEVAGVGLHGRLERDDAESVRAHGDRVRDAVGAERELLRDRGRVGVVEHADRPGERVHDEAGGPGRRPRSRRRTRRRCRSRTCRSGAARARRRRRST